MSEPIGDFALRHTGTALEKTAGGEHQISSHWEGPASGFGIVFGTLHVARPLSEVGATSGSATWVGQAFREDGSVAGGFGEGTWEQVAGQHQWKVKMAIEISTGDRIRTEGVIDLASRTYEGKLFAA